jgi:superfamily II DNA or RNA helicase
MLTPRQYQEEAISTILEKWREGITRQLLSLPTGTGKTVIFALLAQKLDTFTLILAHREELLSQAYEKINAIMPEADAGIFQGSNREGLDSRICIASVQTAVRTCPISF